MPQTKRAVCAHKGEIDEDEHSSILIDSNDLDGVEEWWRRRDSKPLHCIMLHSSKQLQNTNTNGTNLCNNRHLQEEKISHKNKTLTLSEHKYDSSLQKKCAVCVHIESVSPDLKLILNAWSDLPKELRLQIARAVLEIIV